LFIVQAVKIILIRADGLTLYFERENNILKASSRDEPQKSASALKSQQTFGLTGSL
jgi:hypothetical protein